jgi:predicted transcriptional regulator YdeE
MTPPASPTAVSLRESGALRAIGLTVTSPQSELPVAVPRLWKSLETRLPEVSVRLHLDRQLSVFLGRREDIFDEFVGVAVPEHVEAPSGMVRVEVPAGRFAVADHAGPDVENTYRRIFDWVHGQGLEVAPYQEAFHHLEWYTEPVLRDELEFEIWVRLAS